MILKEHLFENWITFLHIDEELIMLIGIRLHTLMPSLEVIIICAELLRGIYDLYFHVNLCVVLIYTVSGLVHFLQNTQKIMNI